jgi:UDP-N-acetyl-D-mannosaminuronic acid dehydrogenase
MKFKTVSVIGLGYIGLPTAAMFASRKIKVVGVDVNETAVETINRGGIHIVEPDLDIAVHSAVTEGFLKATTTPEPAEAFLVAVPTPCNDDNHEPDISFIQRAVEAIAPFLKKDDLVILESTSPVGTTEQMAAWLAEHRPDLTFPQTHGEKSDIRIAHCPERVLPGKVMQELIANDRVIGGMTPLCSALAAELYGIFVTGKCVIASNTRVAEMAKLTENSFRDVSIAFANEISLICDKLDINVWELIELANRHPRVNILQPGPGVGGHCIAVDPWFIISRAPKQSRLIHTARQVNNAKPGWVLKKVQEAIALHLTNHSSLETEKDVVVASFGLTFKANIDDLRESPALEITQALDSAHLGPLLAVEPNINALPSGLDGVTLVSVEEAIEQAHVAVLLVNHREFAEIPVDKLKHLTVVDVQGLWMASSDQSIN